MKCTYNLYMPIHYIDDLAYLMIVRFSAHTISFHLLRKWHLTLGKRISWLTQSERMCAFILPSITTNIWPHNRFYNAMCLWRRKKCLKEVCLQIMNETKSIAQVKEKWWLYTVFLVIEQRYEWLSIGRDSHITNIKVRVTKTCQNFKNNFLHKLRRTLVAKYPISELDFPF